FSEEALSGFPTGTKDDFYEMVAAGRYMYADDKTHDLHPDFKALLTKSEANPEGFMASQRMLQNQNSFSAENIVAKYISHLDEMTYILDGIFTEKISSQTGATLFASTGKSASELEAIAQAYLRLRFLVALQRTSEVAKTLFNAQVQGQELIWHFMTHSP